MVHTILLSASLHVHSEIICNTALFYLITTCLYRHYIYVLLKISTHIFFHLNYFNKITKEMENFNLENKIYTKIKQMHGEIQVTDLSR